MKKITTFIFLICAIALWGSGKDVADTYFGLLQSGAYQSCFDMSSSKMQEMLDVPTLQSAWEGLPEQVGAFEGFLGQRMESSKEGEVHIYTLNFAKMVLDISITVDTQNLVSGLLLRPSDTPKPGIVPPQLPKYLIAPGMAEEDVTFDCGGYTIKGKLTRPAKGAKPPLVLMLTGSGPNDMDETILQRKAFRDIAHGLARQGIATLRWSKRTRENPLIIEDIPTFDIRDEYLSELRSAVAWLRSEHQNDFGAWYLLGHSLGGCVLPMAAQEVGGFNGYIMMAANARPLTDVVIEQYEYILGLQGKSEQTEATLETIRRQALEVKLLTAESPESDSLLLGASKHYWLSLNSYDQVEVFKQTRTPFLILQGKYDYQVRMTDFNIWKKAAKARGNAKCVSYSRLDHLFMFSKKFSTPDNYTTPGFVASKVLTDIGKWVWNLSLK